MTATATPTSIVVPEPIGPTADQFTGVISILEQSKVWAEGYATGSKEAGFFLTGPDVEFRFCALAQATKEELPEGARLPLAFVSLLMRASCGDGRENTIIAKNQVLQALEALRSFIDDCIAGFPVVA